MSHNNFSGEMPLMMHCHSLKSIAFGYNNLHGELPTWIGHNLNKLMFLRLNKNRFQGSMPGSLCDLLYLQILDFSYNNISGTIPGCLNNINALSNITFPRKTISYESAGSFFDNGDRLYPPFMDRAILMWKGEEREYRKYLGFVTTVDLSCNQLEGEIPRSITGLLALVSLNLSRNNLTGSIPSNIGQMKMLESFDLSRNYLSGRIPSSFSNLNFLSYLNLSFNNLSGQIPLSTQLQTFDPSSYIGNNELCGSPLAKRCPGDESSLSPPAAGNSPMNGSEGEDEFITFGFYVSIALGFIFGFWGVCGTLVLKSSWRKAYFQFVNNSRDWIYVRVVLFMARMKRRFQN